MKQSFSGFYSPTDEEISNAWRDKNTIFIFDTNVFLDIYSYKESTREDFFSSLEKLKENIWIPFHVGLEYQRNRLSVISRAKAVFRHAKKELNAMKGLENKDEIKRITDMFPSLLKKTSDLSKKIDSLIDGYENSLKELDDKQPCVRSHDRIREKLNELFCDKVGDAPSQEKINEIESEGEDRYKNKIPPGFKDDNKEEFFCYGNVRYKNKYGDLIIWKQIIEHLDSNKEINNVIFITNDTKKDWWFTIDSGGDKRVGPHALLIDEIKKLENVKLFDMYTSADFLQNTSNYYPDFEVSENSISDVKEIERNNNLSDYHADSDDIFSIMYNFNDLDKWKFHKLSELNEINKLKERYNSLITLEKAAAIGGASSLTDTKLMDSLNEYKKFMTVAEANSAISKSFKDITDVSKNVALRMKIIDDFKRKEKFLKYLQKQYDSQKEIIFNDIAHFQEEDDE